MPQRVLFVDDAASLQRSICEYLTTFGIHCTGVGTVREAVHLIRSGLVDTLVTDLVLGRETAMPLLYRAHAEGLRMIVMSALTTEQIDTYVSKVPDVVHVLEKPCDLSDLRKLITDRSADLQQARIAIPSPYTQSVYTATV